MVVFERGDLVRVSIGSDVLGDGDGAFGVYDYHPIGIIIDILTDSYDFATVLKVRLMDGRIKNITLDTHGRWDKVDLISKGRAQCIHGKEQK